MSIRPPARNNAEVPAQDDLATMGLPRTAEDAPTASQDISAALASFRDPAPPAPGPDQDADALRGLIRLLGAIPVASPAVAQRRVKASPKRIADTVRLIQECGLAPTGIVHRPDGSTAVEIGSLPAPEKRKAKGWEW